MDKFNKMKEKVLERYFEVEEPEDSTEEYQRPHEEVVMFSEEDSHIVEELTIPVIVEKVAPAIISTCTIIEGNIKAENDVEVYGQVIGDVQSTGSIYIENAVVIGNVAANEVFVKNSKIQGNIYSISKVDLQAGAELTGDVKSKEVCINCKCTGNIIAEKIVYLLDHTLLKGDIQTSKIRIDEGAIFEGAIKKNK